MYGHLLISALGRAGRRGGVEGDPAELGAVQGEDSDTQLPAAQRMAWASDDDVTLACLWGSLDDITG